MNGQNMVKNRIVMTMMIIGPKTMATLSQKREEKYN